MAQHALRTSVSITVVAQHMFNMGNVDSVVGCNFTVAVLQFF